MRLLLLAPFLMAAACAPPVATMDEGATAATPAAADPMTIRDALTSGTWTWVRTDEPATGEVMAPTEGAAEHVFTFTGDGRFVEDQLGGCCRQEGAWSLDGATMQLDYDDGGAATWTDVSATADQLTWTQISRHGALISQYRPR